MIQTMPRGSKFEAANYQDAADSPVESILKKIAQKEFPEKEHFENYMRHKWRMNRIVRHTRHPRPTPLCFVILVAERFSKNLSPTPR
jgi:hypothetical protein